MKYLLLIILTSGCLSSDLVVTNIVDGDTFDLSNGERVRLLCIDTPEIDEEGYQEAKDFTSQILGKKVILERDVENRDRYGRLLRMIYFDNNTKSLNEMLLENNLAESLLIEPNVNLCNF